MEHWRSYIKKIVHYKAIDMTDIELDYCNPLNGNDKYFDLFPFEFATKILADFHGETISFEAKHSGLTFEWEVNLYDENTRQSLITPLL